MGHVMLACLPWIVIQLGDQAPEGTIGNMEPPTVVLRVRHSCGGQDALCIDSLF